jgi:hypothetical protein
MFSTHSIKASENEIASLRRGKRYIATSGAQNAQPPKPKGYQRRTIIPGSISEPSRIEQRVLLEHHRDYSRPCDHFFVLACNE